MFQIKTHAKKDLNYVELYSPEGNSVARICLDEGGRLDLLTLNKAPLITLNNAFPYKESYASSILFPFANRVKDGIYSFENKTYNLGCNEEDRNNALHGLVYDKTFKVIKKEASLNFAKLELQYKAIGKNAGFPFAYNIHVIYKMSQNGLRLKLKVKNTDTTSFPFTLGWHPYFLSDDLYNSSVAFDSKMQMESDVRMITKGTSAFSAPMPFQIKKNALDTAYHLDENRVIFRTPKYKLSMTSSAKNNYLQLYTPNILNLIAIEPTTGVSNSLNNKIGLQILEPGQTYKVSYVLDLENN
ncbi:MULTISPECIES: aldose epimerase family protein [unclassified Lacinutrix]